jgi:chromosome segregation ATPase
MISNQKKEIGDEISKLRVEKNALGAQIVARKKEIEKLPVASENLEKLRAEILELEKTRDELSKKIAADEKLRDEENAEFIARLSTAEKISEKKLQKEKSESEKWKISAAENRAISENFSEETEKKRGNFLREIAEKISEIEELNKILSGLKTEIEELRGKKIGIDEEISGGKQELSEISSEISEKEEILSGLGEKIPNEEKRAKDLKRENDELSAEKGNLKTEIAADRQKWEKEKMDREAAILKKEKEINERDSACFAREKFIERKIDFANSRIEKIPPTVMDTKKLLIPKNGDQ